MGNGRDWAAAVLIRTGIGVPLVIERKLRPSYWKLPVGKRKPGEDDPRITAVREAFEETGLVINFATLEEFVRVGKDNHDLIFFSASLTEESKAKIRPDYYWLGREGEEAGIFPYDAFARFDELFNEPFFPDHRVVLEKYDRWPI